MTLDGNKVTHVDRQLVSIYEMSKYAILMRLKVGILIVARNQMKCGRRINRLFHGPSLARPRPPLPPYQKFRCKTPGKMLAKRRFSEQVPQNEERKESVQPRQRLREKQKKF